MVRWAKRKLAREALVFPRGLRECRDLESRFGCAGAMPRGAAAPVGRDAAAIGPDFGCFSV